VVDELERMQGFVWGSVLLETFPAAGYGDDFHSLGVLATRLLLTSEPAQLPSALDAVLSLHRSLGETSGAGSLASGISAAFGREPRFRELLHPGRALAFPVGPEEAVASLGESGWWEMLAFVLRLFPGDLPGAFCRVEHATDLGIFPRAFDDALHAAAALERRLVDLVLPAEPLNARVRAITAGLRRSFAP
jgi:hypothetical protein